MLDLPHTFEIKHEQGFKNVLFLTVLDLHYWVWRVNPRYNHIGLINFGDDKSLIKSLQVCTLRKRIEWSICKSNADNKNGESSISKTTSDIISTYS